MIATLISAIGTIANVSLRAGTFEFPIICPQVGSAAGILS
jgi:hypothetical protein